MFLICLLNTFHVFKYIFSLPKISSSFGFTFCFYYFAHIDPLPLPSINIRLIYVFEIVMFHYVNVLFDFNIFYSKGKIYQRQEIFCIFTKGKRSLLSSPNKRY